MDQDYLLSVNFPSPTAKALQAVPNDWNINITLTSLGKHPAHFLSVYEEKYLKQKYYQEDKKRKLHSRFM